MANKQEVVIEIKGDTSSLDKSIESSEEAVKDLGSTGQNAMGLLDKATGGLATKFTQARGGITQLIKGLNLTKVAIAGTGIGLLVIAIGSLVTYFTKSKRGSELLAQGMAGLSAVFSVITDLAIKLGEGIVNAFQNPKQALEDFSNLLKQYVQDKIDGIIETFGLLGSAAKKLFEGDFSGALEDAGAAAETFIKDVSPVGDIVKIGEAVAEGFEGVAEAMNEAAQAAVNLKQAEQELNDSRRETLVLTARQRANIKALNLIAEDTTKGVEERIAAAEEAGRIERQLFERRRAEAEEALRIRKEQNALSESTAEDLQAEAELEAEVYNLQAESLELQTTLQNKLNTLKQEQLRITQELHELELERYRQSLNLQLDQAEQERGLMMGTATLADQIDKDASQSRKDRFKEEFALYADLAHERLGQVVEFTKGTLSIVESLNTLFSKNEEKRARRSFAIQKALGIASATVATANAIADALAKDAVFPGSRFLAAAAAGAAGAAQIATIARTEFQGGTSIQEPRQPNLNQPTASVTGAPSFNVPTQDSFRSYVLATDVNTAQQASQKIKDQALLLG